ncbi:MAG: bifunctional 1-(5-phosphoribosyl)-5-((5-phosphoribosylamino)methylideneamino)imidazole-4-carboxamide isomerase/phosphoribosylanthranilate isomerase PriA [Mobiluncus porci]|uniref:bifunctional 1-(5-phosphoribosyl)-5-((5- phosphoribosylamino)methylideneamino)imidazole-4- carboxamide isomerase/phosphoribosylanthranilate isomerase PriA n=1 Tax=Mobiluncus porci TaxID=2652278 RepID=UPI0023F18E13|nr:bifunctional 1-(5-phosphoribosyl)-5-((5-phosphoribosylamino)methylideneamino)imidazole-4-carboxamide isomerase/phosphoribosylanthranilate isomerase PriA [Mobiluncus porci]MDD7542284.1 bifunctional 1-(5-phosphoribosyl)-5-((5-phosphoribosylamino)methylideneamino)imidazole-4-carboxamide isomerase/phosphoribosylanthranilate isomerase PriA [Mobiluncus porci]MDY5749083.1 bifunctional 1-(5-phosphoribosyl)-5-((5-phosphoribosylamino)methylideneamino)imidazole-4-carboxamide isomerase/phosphoribosylanthr
MNEKLTLLPAIDLVNGKATRLTEGKAGTEKTYGEPAEVAREFVEAGAEWLHLVDLDAAFGRGSNADLVASLVQANPELKVEVSGGLRDGESLERMLDAGAARVNLGTAAIENPEWCAGAIARFGEKIAVGLDVRGARVYGRGWVAEGSLLTEILTRLDSDGCPRYVVTDVSKDGTLTGPNLDLLARVCEATPAKVVASGGVSTLGDLEALRDVAAQRPNLEGVIVGKAIYEGRFTVEQALKTLG